MGNSKFQRGNFSTRCIYTTFVGDMIKLILLIAGVVFVLARIFGRSKNKFSTERFIAEAKKKPETADALMDTMDFPYKSIFETQIHILYTLLSISLSEPSKTRTRD